MKNYIILVVLLFPCFVFSQSDTIRVDEILVTANRMEEPANQTGRAITILDSKTIESIPFFGVSDLLSQMTPIHIIGAYQTPGALQSLSLRHADNNHTRIMIDGVAINDPSTIDRSMDLSELSLAGIDRVEIIRGSMGVSYGGQTLGGVINLISKKVPDGLSGSIAGTVGTFGNKSLWLGEDISVGLKKGNWYGSVSVSNKKVTGIDASLDREAGNSSFEVHDEDDFRQFQGVVSIGYNAQKWKYKFTYQGNDQLAEIDDGPFSDDDNHQTAFRRNRFGGQIEFVKSTKFNSDFKLFYSSNHRFIQDDSTVIANSGLTDQSFFEANYKGRLLESELNFNWKLKDWDIKSGVNFQQEQMQFQTYFFSSAFNFESTTDWATDFVDANKLGAYIQARWNPVEDLYWHGGVRLDRQSIFGEQLSLHTNLVYSFRKQYTTHLTLSTGYNDPSLYQLFNNESYYASGITRGNKFLLPEQSASIELGIKKRDGLFKPYLNLFYNEISDDIQYVYLWDKEISIESLGDDWLRDDYRGDTYLNLGVSNTLGLEFGMSANFMRWKFNGEVNVYNTKYSLDEDDILTNHTQDHHVQAYNFGDFLNRQITGKVSARRPGINFISQLNYAPHDKINLGLILKYIGSNEDVVYDPILGPFGALGRVELKPYTLLNLTANFKLNSAFDLSFRINNLFNSTYQELQGYNVMGRGFWIRARYQFD